MLAVGLDQPHHDGSDLYVERLGDSAELRVRVPEDAADTVLLRYFRDGEPRTVEASIATRGDGEVWWRAELPLRSRVVSYRWLLTGGRLGYCSLNGTGAHPQEVPPIDDFRLAADPGGPEWHLSSVVYEIFLDRFARGGPARTPPPWAVPREWDRIPEARTRSTNRELFGGDLEGVEQHLDHVTSLGANAIWLTPFFESESNHRYDPCSFDHVDPVVGGDDGLASLAAAARARGVRLVGDLLLDHCGTGHDWFRRAQADADCPERSFFLFDRSESHGYRSWLGGDLPRFDWRSEELRVRMARVVRGWLDRGLDGWRVGAAPLTGRYGQADVNADVRRWMRELVGDRLLVGEFWHDFRPDLDGDGWHGAINYAGFLRPVWWWLRRPVPGEELFDVFSAAPAPTYGGREAAEVMEAFRAGVPWEATLHSWTLLDSHDTPRFGTVSGSRERQLVGVGLQMTTPGVPVIFAGAELGLEGDWGQDARRTMPWDDRDRWDVRLLDGYRRLAALRRSRDALARGGIRFLHASDDVLVYLRESRVERLLCLAARADHPPVAVPFRRLETLYGDDAVDGLLPSHGPAFHAWRIEAD